MTLHPWPQHDDAPTAQHGVWWMSSDSAFMSKSRGLLIDGLAVPLRFALELNDDEPVIVQPDAAAIAIEHRDAALHRVRKIENLMAVRELMQR